MHRSRPCRPPNGRGWANCRPSFAPSSRHSANPSATPATSPPSWRAHRGYVIPSSHLCGFAARCIGAAAYDVALQMHGREQFAPADGALPMPGDCESGGRQGNAARLVRGAHAVPMQGAERRPTRILLVPRRAPDLTAVALAFQRRKRRVSRLTPRHCDTSPGGPYGTPGADTAATRRHIEAECPQRVPFRTQHPLGAVVNRPSVWSDR